MMFSFLRIERREFVPPAGPLPSETAFATRTPDIFGENLWHPVFTETGKFLSRVRGLQHGRIQMYVFYMVLTLLALLLWGLW